MGHNCMAKSDAGSTCCFHRVEREECLRVSHDKLFSSWKVLVGAEDWLRFSQGEEGVSKYRVHNLPPEESGAAVYELGLVSDALAARKRKLKNSHVLPVYVGQAENIRSRLRQYGKDGSHLGTLKQGWLKGLRQGEKGLLEQAFALNYALVFRWAKVPSKEAAIDVEGMLLSSFDYAWNFQGNGTRRPSDAFVKVEKLRPGRLRISLLFFPPPAVGPKIPATRPQEENITVKEIRTPPKGNVLRSKQQNPNIKSMDDNSLTSSPNHQTKRIAGIRIDPTNGGQHCGASNGRGGICDNPPVKGNKRCADHKRLRVAKV